MKDFEVIGIPYLFGKKFFIPNYQRGYRWDIRQIHDLLDDICHFYENASDGEFYCLQPIIVASYSGCHNISSLLLKHLSILVVINNARLGSDL